MSSTALVLAGGLPQIHLINRLKSRGFRTVLADYFEEPIAKPYADVFYRESTLDVPAIRRVAETEGVDLIITCCTDQALSTVSLLSEELGLPCYVGSRTGLEVTNKTLMKRRFVEAGIPTARHVAIEGGLPADCSSLNYPLIVKPADCNSSKGVVRVDDERALEGALSSARMLSRTGAAVVEEFIEGEELSVDCFIVDGKASVLSIARNDKVRDGNGFVICRSVSTPEIRSENLDTAERVAQRIADAFGLGEGPMLIQLLKNDEGMFVIEFSARTGGCTKYRLIDLAIGVDVIDATIDASLGKKVRLHSKDNGKTVVDEFLYSKEGVFDHFENVELCKSKGLVEGVYALRAPGTRFDGSVTASGDRVASIVYEASSYGEYLEMSEEVGRLLLVKSPEGEDLARFDLLRLD